MIWSIGSDYLLFCNHAGCRCQFVRENVAERPGNWFLLVGTKFSTVPSMRCAHFTCALTSNNFNTFLLKHFSLVFWTGKEAFQLELSKSNLCLRKQGIHSVLNWKQQTDNFPVALVSFNQFFFANLIEFFQKRPQIFLRAQRRPHKILENQNVEAAAVPSEAVPHSSATMRLRSCTSLLLALVATVQLAGGQKDQFANNLKSCVASNPDINVCLVKTLEDLRSLMPVGIPELNLRPTEPFQINNLKFKTRPGLGISIDSTFTDVRTILLLQQGKV